MTESTNEFAEVPVTYLDAPWAAAYARKWWDLPIRASTFGRYRRSGRGPLNHEAGYGGSRPLFPRDIDRWLRYGFCAPEFDKLGPNDTAPRPRTSLDKCRWLVAVSDLLEDALVDTLDGWGCDVVCPSGHPRSILHYAERADVDIAIFDQDWNVELAMAATDHMTNRQIPFVLISNLYDLPATLASHDCILRGRWSEGRFRNLLRDCMPAGILRGINFDAYNARFDDEEYGYAGTIRTVAPQSFRECLYQNLGECECNPASPDCAERGDPV